MRWCWVCFFFILTDFTVGWFLYYVSIRIKIAIFLGGAVTYFDFPLSWILNACQIKFDCTISPIFSLLFNGLSNSSAVLQTSCNVKTKEGAEPRNVVNNLLWVGYHDSWKQLRSCLPLSSCCSRLLLILPIYLLSRQKQSLSTTSSRYLYQEIVRKEKHLSIFTYTI